MVSSSSIAEVTTIVLSALATTDSMRSNKLRKIVCNKECKELKLSWTDFQEIIDKLISDGKVLEKELGDGSKELGLVDSLASSSASTAEVTEPASPSDAKAKKRKTEDATNKALPTSSVVPIPESFTAKRSEEIPVKVALHLLKQQEKKKKNIEINTKTRLLIKGDFKGNATATLEIYAEEAKRLDAAMVFVTKFRQAYKKNPDHFEGDRGKKRDGQKRQRKYY